MNTKIIENRLISFVAMFILAAAFLLPAITYAAEQDVSGDTFDGTSGWLFNRDTNNATPIQFNNDEATIGAGSLYVEPIANDAPRKFIGELFTDGLLVSDFNSFTYDFQIGTGGDVSDTNEFYLNVYTILPGTGSTYYDCKFDYVPTVGAVGSFTSFSSADSDTPARVVSRGGAVCPATLAEMPAGSFIPFFAINLGDTSLTDVGVDGYFDNVVVDTASEITTYDFDPVPPFERSLEIIEPSVAYEVVSEMVDFEALYVDEDGDDSVAWAVRAGTCAADDSANVAGNVGGFSTDFDWTGGSFTSTVDMSSLDDGDYCFIINPQDDDGEEDLRATRWFTLENPDSEAPVVTIESPDDGDVVTGVVDVVGSVSDDNLSHYNVSLYPEGVDVNNFLLRLDGETTYGTEVTSVTLWSFDSNDYADGVYQIRLAARDLAGNRDLSTPDVGGDDSVHVIEIVIDNVPNDPLEKNECKKGGWEDFGFKNQGQCVRLVETGKDSR